MINDDGDVIKAVGYMTIYSSYLEGEIGSFLSELHRINGSTASPNMWQISSKINECKKLLPDAVTNHDEIVKIMDDCLSKLHDRNEVTHGQIIAGLGGEPDKLVLGKGDGERDITSKEVYDLANSLFELQGDVYGMVFRIRKLD